MISKIKKRLKNYFLTKLLKGYNVQCNICKKGFTTFIPHLNRINACCPNCGSLERTRLLWYYLEKKGLLLKSRNLLHVAPETCLYTLFLNNKNINYLPIDKFTEGYKYPPKTVEMDITKLELEDAVFDGVICIHVLEHVIDDIGALQEFYRVLKNDSWALILVPFDKNRNVAYEDSDITSPANRRKHFGQSDHVRIYGVDFIERFESVGFVVEDWGFETTVPFEVKNKYVFRNEHVFLLRKK